MDDKHEQWIGIQNIWSRFCLLPASSTINHGYCQQIVGRSVALAQQLNNEDSSLARSRVLILQEINFTVFGDLWQELVKDISKQTEYMQIW